jgi:hypothetical protein
MTKKKNSENYTVENLLIIASLVSSLFHHLPQKKLLVVRCVFSGSSNCLLLSDMPFVLSCFFEANIAHENSIFPFADFKRFPQAICARKVVFAATTPRDVDNERDAGTRKNICYIMQWGKTEGETGRVLEVSVASNMRNSLKLLLDGLFSVCL